MAPAKIRLPSAHRFLLDDLGTYRYRVSYGGRASGGSWSIARALLGHGIRQPLRILCARDYQSSIADSVHKLLSDQIRLLRLGGNYRVLKTSIIGRNRTEFIFKGIRRDPDKFKSTEGVDVCWYEEAQTAEDRSWEVLIPTIRKPGSEIWVRFNPDQEDDPTYQRMVAHPPKRSVVRKVTFRDNPFLPAVMMEEQEELLRRDPEAHAHIWDGHPWRRSKAEVMGGRWRVDEFEPQAHWDGPYYGLDFGFALSPSRLVKLWIADSRVFWEHEAGGVQLLTDDLERAIREVPGAGEHKIRADAARPETIAELKTRGLDVVAAPKWQGSVKDGIQHFHGYEEHVIHPRCTATISDFKHWRYKTDARTGDVLPQLIDAHDHSPDAGRYALAPLIQQSGRKVWFA